MDGSTQVGLPGWESVPVGFQGAGTHFYRKAIGRIGLSTPQFCCYLEETDRTCNSHAVCAHCTRTLSSSVLTPLYLHWFVCSYSPHEWQ